MDSLPVSASSHPQRSWLVVQLGIGLSIGGLALVWAMRGLDWRLVLRGLATAHYGWVLLSLGCVVGVALAKAARWGVLYTVSERNSSFWDLFSALMITQMFNVLIPIRVGELVRIGLMKQTGQPGAATLSTIVIEKALDLAAVGLIAVSLVMLAVAPAWLQESSSGIFLVGLALVIGLALVWRLRGWMERMLARVLACGGWVPDAWQKRLLRVTHTMLQAFGALADLNSFVRVLFWTALVWTLSLLTMVTLLAAFGLSVPAAAAVVMMLSIGFSGVIPSPPAMVGVMHAIAVVVLGEYGVPQTVALGFGIVLNIVTVAPLILLGGVALWHRATFSIQSPHRLSFRDLWSKLL